MRVSDVMTQAPQLFKHIWSRLTDEEIHAYEERRDEFFMAIRRKHGMARAEAEIILREIQNGLKVQRYEII